MYKKLLLTIFFSFFGALFFTNPIFATDWFETNKITSLQSKSQDFFGSSVDISGDYAVISAVQDDTRGFDAGAAYVYHWNGSAWVEQIKLTASDGVFFDKFGSDVAIDGDYIIIGADSAKYNGEGGVGAAYIFHRLGDTWTQQAKIRASNAAANYFFGKDVDISGDYVIVGANTADYDQGNQGFSYIFHRVGNVWTQQAQFASDGLSTTNDAYGKSVSIDGDYAVVGAYYDQYKGAIYIYHRVGDIWAYQSKVTSEDIAQFDQFGGEISIYGDQILVSASGDNNNAGAAYLFQRSGNTWIQQSKFVASEVSSNKNFGRDVSLSNNVALIGSYEVQGTTYFGAAYVLNYEGGVWVEQKLPSTGVKSSDLFAYGLAVDGVNAIVGAFQDDTIGIDAGAVYSYRQNQYVIPQVGELKGKVWYDENGNAIKETSETYELKNIYISLYKDVDNSHTLTASDTLLATQNSGNGLNNGSYAFDNLPVGDYLIKVDKADSDLNNSVINASRTYGLITREVRSISVVAGQIIDNLDFGFDEVEVRASVSTNSIYESAIPTAEANMFFSVLPLSAFPVSINLSYSGDATPNVDYNKLDFVYIDPFVSSSSFVVKVNDDTVPEVSELINIDVFSVSGARNSIASPISITIYDNDPIISQHSISGNVWLDNNTNGLKDSDDTVGLKNVEVKLYKDVDSSQTLTQVDILLDTINSDFFGKYSFNNLNDGQYVVVINDSSVALKNDTANGNKTYGLTTSKSISVPLQNNDFINNDFGFAIAQVSMTVDKSTLSEDPELGNTTNVTVYLSVPTAFETGLVFAYGGTAQSYKPVATANLDYTKLDYISIPAGSKTVSFSIKAVQDTLAEYPEVFDIELAGAVNASVVGTSKITVTIFDDNCTLDFGLYIYSPRLICKSSSPSATNGRTPASNFSNLPSRLPEQSKQPILPVQSKAPVAPIKQTTITTPVKVETKKQVCNYVTDPKTKKLTYVCK